MIKRPGATLDNGLIFFFKDKWNKNVTVFPQIVSAETVLFWIYPYVLWPLITLYTGAETIQGRKLFKGGNYSRKYGILPICKETFFPFSNCTFISFSTHFILYFFLFYSFLIFYFLFFSTLFILSFTISLTVYYRISSDIFFCKHWYFSQIVSKKSPWEKKISEEIG